MTLARVQFMIHRCGDKSLPSLIRRHFSLHSKRAALLCVQVKASRFPQGSSVQDFKGLKRAANLQNRAARHLHDHRAPLELSGVENFIRMHCLPPIESLPGSEREGETFVPAFVKNIGEAA
ncbi:hypothetical protein [Rhizobium sp. Root1204]|uniref:hypothetical protein n=1 Tax=Rhizobium sp. Root1204 TaxID=1736428 RepID=UPI000712EB91|nr:hypothetical protein [Rhizobium sp. Root1204]KQV31124.1 hypothetical protein ASC96_08000 [Rhizobium sp. Root1204]